MLTDAQLARRRGRRRATASPQQLYREFLVHRIEAYKNSISRAELMALAGEALADGDQGTEGQLVLTEVMMLDYVDRLIRKRLRLPTFKTWKQRYGRQRAEQREPAYWGVSDSHPVATLLPRIEPGDRALLIGGRTESLAPLLAANDVDVTFLAGTITVVERVERRAEEESLTGSVEAFVVQVGRPWLPPAEQAVHLVVIDAAELDLLPLSDQVSLVRALQGRLAAEGVQVLTGHPARSPGVRDCFDGWRELPVTSDLGAIFLRGPRRSDDTLDESLQHTLLDARD